MSDKRIIGLIGKKRSGKDTVAEMLCAFHGFDRVAFADPLKDAAYDLNPILGMAVYPGELAPVGDVRLRDYVRALGWEKAKEHPEVRRTLQELGLAVRMNVGQHIWLDVAMDKVDAMKSDVVISDVRFPNEAEETLKRGGVLWRVERDGTGGDGHISEHALNDWRTQVTIDNNGDLVTLARRVEKAGWCGYERS